MILGLFLKKPGFDDEAAGGLDGVEVDFLLGDVAGVCRLLDVGEDVAEGGGQLGGELAGVGEAGVVLPLSLAGGAGDGGVGAWRCHVKISAFCLHDALVDFLDCGGCGKSAQWRTGASTLPPET